MKPVSNDEYLESILVGSVLAYPDAYPDAAEIVKLTDFVGGSAFKCWAAISQHWSVGDNSDLGGKVYLSLTSEADKQWYWSATNGTIPLRSAVRSTAIEISQSAKRRRIAADLDALSGKAKSSNEPPDILLENLMALYRKEAGNVDTDASICAAMGRFRAVQAKNQEQGFVGKNTGFGLLARDFIVYQPGHLWVIGAWTSTGKTAMMIEAINRFFSAHEQGRVAVFSTEMTEEQNVARMLANKTGVSANVILSGNMLDRHKTIVDATASWLAGKDLYVYTKTRHIDEIISQCRKLKCAGGVDLVWIDFIQNVYRPGVGDQYTMMSQIAKDLQALAHDIGCTVVCLSQLPNHAGREDTGILEFKGAGEIAAACDVGVLMKRAKEDKRKILFDVRKNRHGKTGKYIMKFNDSWTGIEEVEEAV